MRACVGARLVLLAGPWRHSGKSPSGCCVGAAVRRTLALPRAVCALTRQKSARVVAPKCGPLGEIFFRGMVADGRE